MLSRFISKPSNFRIISRISSQSKSSSHTCSNSTVRPNFNPLFNLNRFFSSNDNDNNNSSNNNNYNGRSIPSFWTISPENDDNSEQVFGDDTGDLSGFNDFDANEVKPPPRRVVNEAQTRGRDGVVSDNLKGGGGRIDIGQSGSSSWSFSQENDGKSEQFFTDDFADLAGMTDFDAGEAKPDNVNKEVWTRGNDIFEVNETSKGGSGGRVGQSTSSSSWSFSPENDGKSEPIFTDGTTHFDAAQVILPKKTVNEEVWTREGDDDDRFKVNYTAEGAGGGDRLSATELNKPWSFDNEEKDSKVVFDIGGHEVESDELVEMREEAEKLEREEAEKLEREEKELMNILKGPDRAFGDLIAASGITDAMLDSLIALKDFSGTPGLRPLSELEYQRYENTTKKSSRGEIERLKQEEVAKARVRQVDGKGRAYGTGRRKCSIARVCIQPGKGNFFVNDKEFDVYFPRLEHRAALLRPFSETKTLGIWDIISKVQGGGCSGQVGAIRLGISRALQNWEPGFRPALKAAGFLTRDPRVVERKKPGKAKARKSFAWVKR